MLGTFQQSHLRIEVEATQAQIQASLLQPSQFRQWIWPQGFDQGLPTQLTEGLVFHSYLGPVEVRHQVQQVNDHSLHLLLAGGIDGFHQWYWGDQWVQSRLEGISALPLNLAQTMTMWRFRRFLNQQRQSQPQG